MKKIILSFLLSIIVSNANAYDIGLINTVYKTFDEQYIKADVIEDLSMKTLKALNDFDKDIIISDDNDTIGIYYKAKKRDVLRKPQNNDYQSWAKATNDVILKAIELSTKLKKKDYLLVDMLFDKVINNYDNQANKYLSDIKVKKLRTKHSPKFASYIKDSRLYITIKNINDTSASSIKEVVTTKKDAKELVLDLRGNGGGSLKSALDIINLFVDGGIVFSTSGRAQHKKVFQATEGDIFNHKKIYVIVDEKTASSAELIAFVLGQQIRATIIGTQTYGKNTIQDSFIIDGRRLVITTEKFFDPNGDEPKINPQFLQIP